MGGPMSGGHDSTVSVGSRSNTDSVDVLACPEMSRPRSREFAWDLERTSTVPLVKARTALPPGAPAPGNPRKAEPSVAQLVSRPEVGRPR
jgi:hypothetical protein